MSAPLCVTTAPQRIWLQHDDGLHGDEPFPSDHEGITWCHDSIGDNDVEYVRADLAAPAAAPAAPAPSECRGYAHLGIGAYVINHSRAGTEPELVISLATEEEKRGRVVGDTRDNQPDAVLQPDAMVVRLRFENEVGFDALLHQLKLLREVHFPDPDDGRYHGFPPQDAAPAPDADGLRALLRRGRSMIVEVAADLATGKWLLSEFREDHEGMVTRATMRKIRGQNEAMRRQAIKLRAAFDALAPLFDTVEQQARELAQVMRERNDANRACLEELTRADRAERDLSAARAAIAAADDVRTHMKKVTTCKCGGDNCGWCRKVKAYDRLRAAMGDGNG